MVQYESEEARSGLTKKGLVSQDVILLQFASKSRRRPLSIWFMGEWNKAGRSLFNIFFKSL